MDNYHKIQSVTEGAGYDLVDGYGIELMDSDGNVFLDLNEICTVLGQKHERFTRRVAEQLNSLNTFKTHISPAKEKLFCYLNETTNNQYRYIHMTSSGSEASEWAVRMALKMTGRNEVLSFWNSIHGRTYLSASMSGMERRKQGYAPSAPGVLYGIYPDCAHCPFEKKCEGQEFFCLKFLDEKMKYESSGEIGAVIVEAYQGSGIIVPPKGWLKALETWTHEHGALFILDEIQSGMGRTGKMYSYIDEGLEPDMLLLGKALGNGLHVGALLTKDVPDDFYRMALAGGAGDSELTCAAGCAVFEELLEHGLLEHIQSVSDYIHKQLTNLFNNYDAMAGICVKGLAFTVEFKDSNVYADVLEQFKKEHLLAGAGTHNKIIFRPPYVIEKRHVDKIVETIECVLKKNE